MKLFKCQHCGQVLYFENVRCEKCAHRLGYLPDGAVLSALEESGAAWTPLAAPDRPQRFCANAEHDVCNWLIPAESDEKFCLACRHNRTIPNLAEPENVERWRRLEYAKHRLFYTMLRLGLPLETRVENPEHGLAFEFLDDPPAAAGPKVLTGHDEGLITISLREADDAEREQRRVAMHEPYRTLLGHFRHEVGHHFWDVLVRDGGHLDAFRKIFGDERADYNAALQAHYQTGAPADWRDSFISAYATTHPWEDFAETWAHYLHMIDALEMAHAFGLSVHPRVTRDPDMSAEVDFDPHTATDVTEMVDAWLPISFALNSLNRCMGQNDFYPFVLSPAVIEKLGFINEVVRAQGKPADVKAAA